VHFTADGEFRELLERVRGLAGHRLPSGDLMTLLKCGLEAYERELAKERFGVGRKPVATETRHPCPLRPISPRRLGPSVSSRRPLYPEPIASQTPNLRAARCDAGSRSPHHGSDDREPRRAERDRTTVGTP